MERLVIFLTMQVRERSPMNESLSTRVSLLARNGRWAPFLPSALMHSLRASNDLLISAPSIPKYTIKNYKNIY